MSKIGQKVLEEISTHVKDLMELHRSGLDRAYLAHGDELFKISFSIELSPDGGGTKVVTAMTFKTELPVKEKLKGVVIEDQLKLSFDQGKEKEEEENAISSG